MENKAAEGAPTTSTEIIAGPTVARHLGFGSKVIDKQARMVNPDGTANVVKLGRPWFRPYDVYLTLISIPPWQFAAGVFMFYFVVNLVFSGLYMLVGVEQLTGMVGESTWDLFVEAFFFSSQTVTTLGYGRIAPIGHAASLLAAVESLVGLLGFALATGLLYGRFSRAEAKIKFSTHAVVAPYEGGSGLMMRIANERSSQLIEAEAVLTVAYFEKGSERREYEKLELETDKITFLPMSWTVVHPISESSPIHGWTYSDFLNHRAEFILLIKGFDDSFGATVYQRRSYIAEEVRWAEKFVPILGSTGKQLTVDLGKLSESAPADLPG